MRAALCYGLIKIHRCSALETHEETRFHEKRFRRHTHFMIECQPISFRMPVFDSMDFWNKQIDVCTPTPYNGEIYEPAGFLLQCKSYHGFLNDWVH